MIYYIIKTLSYHNSYYIGAITTQCEPNISFDIFSQLLEVDAIKWINLEEMKYLNQNDNACNYTTKILKIIKNRCKHIKENEL